MCTLSWFRRPDGYTVLFNRDERRSRPAATPPARRDIRGMPTIFPVDPEGEGTWLGTNARGVTIALANRYPLRPVPVPTVRISRGQLVLDLLDAADLDAVRARLAAADLRPYEPFTIAAFQPDTPAWSLAWEAGRRATVEESASGFLLTSSAVDQEGAELGRRAAFHGALTPRDLEQVHRGHEPRRGALSVCMHRRDARTVSFSAVDVAPDRLSFRYEPAAPCDHADAHVAVLARDRTSSAA